MALYLPFFLPLLSSLLSSLLWLYILRRRTAAAYLRGHRDGVLPLLEIHQFLNMTEQPRK
jgi:hypothetical protein